MSTGQAAIRPVDQPSVRLLTIVSPTSENMSANDMLLSVKNMHFNQITAIHICQL